MKTQSYQVQISENEKLIISTLKRSSGDKVELVQLAKNSSGSYEEIGRVNFPLNFVKPFLETFSKEKIEIKEKAVYLVSNSENLSEITIQKSLNLNKVYLTSKEARDSNRIPGKILHIIYLDEHEKILDYKPYGKCSANLTWVKFY